MPPAANNVVTIAAAGGNGGVAPTGIATATANILRRVRLRNQSHVCRVATPRPTAIRALAIGRHRVVVGTRSEWRRRYGRGRKRVKMSHVHPRHHITHTLVRVAAARAVGTGRGAGTAPAPAGHIQPEVGR